MEIFYFLVSKELEAIIYLEKSSKHYNTNCERLIVYLISRKELITNNEQNIFEFKFFKKITKKKIGTKILLKFKYFYFKILLKIKYFYSKRKFSLFVIFSSLEFS